MLTKKRRVYAVPSRIFCSTVRAVFLVQNPRCLTHMQAINYDDEGEEEDEEEAMMRKSLKIQASFC